MYHQELHDNEFQSAVLKGHCQRVVLKTAMSQLGMKSSVPCSRLQIVSPPCHGRTLFNVDGMVNAFKTTLHTSQLHCIVAASKPVPVDKHWMLEIYQGQLHTLQLMYCITVRDLQDA